MLYLAAFDPDNCDLPGLHGVLWKGESAFLASVIQPMQESEALEGALRQYGDDVQELAGKRENIFGSFRDEARQALSIFAKDASCGRVCQHSGLDFGRLMNGNLTVYLVLPPERVESHGRWMGLVISHAVHAVSAARTEGDCVFLLDEFPNLGRLPGVKSAIAQLRGKGLRVWLFVQELAQLEDVYGKADAESMRYQAEVVQVLGCRSPELAEYIEKRAGKRTEKVSSFSMPDPWDESGAPRQTLNEEAMAVLPAADALNMARGEQILIRHGFPVIWADVEIWQGG